MRQQILKINLIKLAISVLTIKVMCSTSLLIPWNSLIDNVCIIIGIFVFLIKMYGQRFTIPQFCTICFWGIFILYTCVTMKNYDLLITFITVCLLQNEELDEYISIIFKIEVLIITIHLLLAIILSLLGGGHEFLIVTGTRTRFSGGFTHPNVLSAYVFSCMIMYVWKHFGEISGNEFCELVLVMLGTYFATKSRTSFLLNILLLLLIFLGQNKQNFMEKIMNRVLKYVFPFMSLFVYWAQKNYLTGNIFIIGIDNLLSGRLKYAAYAYETSGITWFPRYLDYVESGKVSWDVIWNLNTFTFDNIYSFLFIQMGGIWIVLISVLIIALCKKCSYKCKVFILIWIFFSMTEVHGLNCYKFFPILLVSYLISDEGVIEKDVSAIT